MSNCRDRLEEEINKIGVTAVSSGLGVARNTVYNWLAKANIPLPSLKALEGLGADIGYVLFGEEDRERSVHKVPINDELAADEQLLLEAYRDMKPAKRKALLAELLTGKKQSKPDASITVKGSNHRVAGNDYYENDK
ncbi:hypothetical protein [Marinobacter sp.]|uniref:hypothetical protein n=1 Tax=Marinobacter sp. TaxID=50741 RepID=UPI0034A34668